MSPRNHPTQEPATAPGEAVTFALERFSWGAPDRLELAGTFDGLDAAPSGAAVLVLAGVTGTYRLTASPGDVSGVPVNGEPWFATFVWQDAPAAFDAAVLELGDELMVDLPAPGMGASPVALEARSTSFDDSGAPSEPAEPAAAPERLGAEAERLTLWEDLHLAKEQARRLGDELARAREDLETEREGRAEDAARYRAGLAQMREAADAALQEQAGGLSSATAEVEQLREELAAARAEAEEARNRIATVREALQFPEPGQAEG
jgi:hypothetical protein